MDYSANYDAVFASLGVGFFVVYFLFMLAIMVLILAGFWKLFTKAGKPGWAAIVPFYNSYCLFDIAWGSGWLFLLTFVPCVNFVVMIILYFKIAKAYGQGTGFGFGLLLLPYVFFPILGFGKSEYVGPQA